MIDRVKTTPVELNLIEQGWLMVAVWDRAQRGDPYARSIYLKLKSAAVAAGVEWYYGDPWPLEPGSSGG